MVSLSRALGSEIDQLLREDLGSGRGGNYRHGDGRGKLNDFKPKLENVDPKRKGRHTLSGLQLKDQTNTTPLLGYERSISGQAHNTPNTLEVEPVHNPF